MLKNHLFLLSGGMGLDKWKYYDANDGPVWARHTISYESTHRDYHFHNSYEIYLFLAGQAQMFVEQTCYQILPGSLLVFNSSEIHKASYLGDGPFERITIQFDPKLVHMLPLPSSNLLACFVNRPAGEMNASFLAGPELDRFVTVALALSKIDNVDEYGNDAMALAYLTELLVITNKAFMTATQYPGESISGLIEHAMAYIHDNLSTPLSLQQVAGYLNISQYHLAHQFKERTGSSLYRYILLKRMALAKTLLAQGHTVSEVCEMTGFQDYNNFIRTFRKYVGFTPGKFKKQFN